MTQQNPEGSMDPLGSEIQAKLQKMESKFNRLFEEWSIRLEARERSLIQKEEKLEGLIMDLARLKQETIPQWMEGILKQMPEKKVSSDPAAQKVYESEFRQKMDKMENDFRHLLEQMVQEENMRSLEQSSEPSQGRRSKWVQRYLDKLKDYFPIKSKEKRGRPDYGDGTSQNFNGYRETQVFQEPKGETYTRIITVANQKGGCGKTTTCINLAAGLAKKGYKVLVIDMDPQGHASLGLGIDIYNLNKSIYDVMIHDAEIESVIAPTYQRDLDIAPAASVLTGAPLEMADLIGRESLLKMSLTKMLREEPGKYDYVLMDCSPSLDLLTINALVAAPRVLIPIQAHYFSLEGMRELFSTIQIVREKYNPQLDALGILPTIFDPTSHMSRQMLAQLKEYFKDKLLNSIIHVNMLLAEASAHGKSIFDFAPDSNAADDNWALVDEVISLTHPVSGIENPRANKLGASGTPA